MVDTRFCEFRKKCGSCQILNLSYEEELSLKMKREISLLGKFCHVEEIIPSNPNTHYRNKVQYLFNYKSGHVITGLYRSSDKGITSISTCLMEDKKISKVFEFVKKSIIKFKIKVYDGHKGDLRHVMIRRGNTTGEISVSFITFRGRFQNDEELADYLIHHSPEITTVTCIQNNTAIPIWMDGQETTLRGKGYLTDKLCGCTFNVPPKAFYQINPYTTEILYNKAAELSDPKPSDLILDAYCGVGTIGISVAKNSCQRLEGFDCNSESIKYAKINASLNGIKEYEFLCTTDSKYFKGNSKAYDIVFIDPPRAGCTSAFLSNIMRLNAKIIIYISCFPETLSRDISKLKSLYDIKTIQPIDMFPGTTHVETVCCLYHQKKDFISVPYEPKNDDYLKQHKTNFSDET